MTLLIARIAMRYVAGLLVGYGILGHSDVAMIVSDPELERELALAIGMLAGVVIEGVYMLAKRYGWRT